MKRFFLRFAALLCLPLLLACTGPTDTPQTGASDAAAEQARARPKLSTTLSFRIGSGGTGGGVGVSVSSHATAAQNGLRAVQGYPEARDICQLLRPSRATRGLHSDSSLLIACPTVEAVAIAEREDAGATAVRRVGAWQLLRVPRGAVRGPARLSEPEASGLRALQAFPEPGAVCRVIGANSAVRDLLDQQRLLVGCPMFESQAIAEVTSRGAVPLRRQGQWSLFAAPKS